MRHFSSQTSSSSYSIFHTQFNLHELSIWSPKHWLNSLLTNSVVTHQIYRFILVCFVQEGHHSLGFHLEFSHGHFILIQFPSEAAKFF